MQVQYYKEVTSDNSVREPHVCLQKYLRIRRHPCSLADVFRFLGTTLVLSLLKTRARSPFFDARDTRNKKSPAWIRRAVGVSN
jgi:hypothetical protein